jgi:MFS superfamily sulfate permease-like transporter
MNQQEDPDADTSLSVPQSGLAGLAANWKQDLTSGFLVFLIALPLCLAIAKASGFPAITGIFTAIIGGIVTPFFSNSELTIKGPAAGMIAIVLGTVSEFGWTGKNPEADFRAYQMALGIFVVAGVLQILFGLFKGGILGDFFPSAAVHGLLASIGIIIASGQIHLLLGVTPEATKVLPKILEIPHSIMNMNPNVATIGLVSLAIMFGMPMVKSRIRWLSPVPSQLVVLLVAVPMGWYFGLQESFRVNLPDKLADAITMPDYSRVATWPGFKWIMMVAIVGTLESMLSAKAIDLIDPWKRKTNLDRDMLGVGIANTLCALIGALPMISEIVRSRANIDNGARSRFANMFHGLCLLAFVIIAGSMIELIPISCLAAMLIFTGYRLASPAEFLHTYQVGREQLIIFVSTIVAVLATDLLIGMGVGVLVKFLIHLFNGAPFSSLFMPQVTIEDRDEHTSIVNVQGAAVFSNWIPLRKKIERIGLAANKSVVLDLSETRLVDHTVMTKLREVEMEFESHNLKFEVLGLEQHSKLSEHLYAARKKKKKAKVAVLV